MLKLASIGKIWRYNPLLLIEAFILLNKWDKTIKQQPYSTWKHNLASQSKREDAKDTKDTKNTNAIAKPSKTKQLHLHLQAIVRHHYKHMNCLRRCLALKDMLEKRHIPCKLHIGVKLNEQGKMAAHSWISVNNELINDSQQEISKYQEITHNNALFANSNLL